ncbi:DoxX family protein, partial [bacterium]|nr:DoxX family protein [bacterium]
YDKGVSWLSNNTAIPLLLARLTIGAIFIQSGVGKLTHLADATQFFIELGIPFPHVNALFSSSTEIVAGILILIGLFTRIATIPLIIIMIVAIATAQAVNVKSVLEFAGLQEWDYIVILALLLISGPGKASVDFLLRKSVR